MWILLWIIMFMSLVLLHELGHFISAKKSGVKVLEFGIGIPPKICKLRTDKSGTQYTLNLLPLGWFVRLKWEDPNNQEDFHAKDSFIKAKIWKKIIIIVAGVGMNVLVARILFSFIFWQGTKPVNIIPENALNYASTSYLMPTFSFLEKEWFASGDISSLPLKILSISTGGLWDNLWLNVWDLLLTVNDIKVTPININLVIKNTTGLLINIQYKRLDTIRNAHWTCSQTWCLLWIWFESPKNIVQDFTKTIKFPLGKAMLAGLHEIGAETKLTFNALWTLGKGLFSFNKEKFKLSLDGMTWPVWAVIIGKYLLAEWWWKLYLGFAAMISLALAIFNILPIPALDGGRLLSILIQWIGKLKPEKYFTIENYINLVFFVLLMWLGVYIILKDLVRFEVMKIPFLS